MYMYEFASDFVPGECATEGLDRATQYTASDLFWSILLGKIAVVVYVCNYVLWWNKHQLLLCGGARLH